MSETRIDHAVLLTYFSRKEAANLVRDLTNALAEDNFNGKIRVEVHRDRISIATGIFGGVGSITDSVYHAAQEVTA